MLPQTQLFQSNRASDEENTSTPRLTSSCLSLHDPPPLSPLNLEFSGSPSTQLPLFSDRASSDLEEHLEAWWHQRDSADMSGSTSVLDFRPRRLLKLQMPNEIDLSHKPILRPENSATCSKDSPSWSINRQEQIALESQANSIQIDQRDLVDQTWRSGDPKQFTNLSHPLTPQQLASSSCFIQPPVSLDLNAIQTSLDEMEPIMRRRGSVPIFEQAGLLQIPNMETSHTENDCCVHINYSRPQSSMLAHCQDSLSPPCEALSQTHCGRLTLCQAGIAHGSTRALAPSPLIENVPLKQTCSKTTGFFQKLVHKTFARSLSATSPRPMSAAVSPHQHSVPQRRTQQHSRMARYSMVLSFSRPQIAVPEGIDMSNQSNTSRWNIIHRFIRPSTTPRQAASDSNVHAGTTFRRSFRTGSRFSSVSFLDGLVSRTDPFARPGGLGATVSNIGTPERLDDYSHRPSAVPNISATHTSDKVTHMIGFPTGEGRIDTHGNLDVGSMTEFQAPAMH